MPDPTECFNSLSDYAALTGRRFEVGYAAALEAFTGLLESRKEGLGGCWFTAPGESSKDAFMRRLKTADPAYAIFQAFGVSEELSAAAKLEQEQLVKLADVGKLQAMLDAGQFCAVEGGTKITLEGELSKSLEDFDAQREKAVDVIMATKTTLDRKK